MISIVVASDGLQHRMLRRRILTLSPHLKHILDFLHRYEQSLTLSSTSVHIRLTEHLRQEPYNNPTETLSQLCKHAASSSHKLDRNTLGSRRSSGMNMAKVCGHDTPVVRYYDPLLSGIIPRRARNGTSAM